MLYKLAFRNMRRSLSDYTIYFLTLLFGISIFYMFNALGSQSVLESLNSLAESTKNSDGGALTSEVFSGLEKIMDYVSAFVAMILGFLVVYANTFMIRRRKKEFGVYLTLGMSTPSISAILVIETLLVGLVSLVVGIITGVLLSQLMSVFVVQMFGIEAEGTTFVFSMQAMIKTITYFGVVFLLTLFINMITVSGSRLVRLLNAEHRSKTMKVKRPFISIALFAAGVLLLVGGFVYTEMQYRYLGNSVEFARHLTVLVMVMVFAVLVIIISLSGFLLSLLSVSPGIRFKGLNVFVIKQLGSKLYSTVFSMTLTTLILTITLTSTAAALSISVAERSQMMENYPTDLFLWRRQDYETLINNQKSIYDELKDAGLDVSLLSDHEEIEVHSSYDVTYKLIYDEDDYNKLKEMNKLDAFATAQSVEIAEYDDFFSGPISVLFLSDYNKLAKMYNKPQIKLEKDEYSLMCNADGYIDAASENLKEGKKIVIAGKEYHPAKNDIIFSNLFPMFMASNTGILILPDGSEIITDPFAKDRRTMTDRMLLANYDRSKKPAKEIERMFNGGFEVGMSENSFGDIDCKNNEYYPLWEKVYENGKVKTPDEAEKALTAGMKAVYDSNGLLAYHRESDDTYWTVNEDKTELVPFKGKVDIKALWDYNREYACQYGYVEGYTLHVSDLGYPVAYEDADGKFYTTTSTFPMITPDGSITEVVGGLAPIDYEWAPENDYIYDRKDDCIYQLLPGGKKNRIELSTLVKLNGEEPVGGEEFFNAEMPDSGNDIYYVFYSEFTRIGDVEVGIQTTSCVLFIALYIGMVFLMACAAVLGLKQLSDSADNKTRYTTLRQVGCSEKMITGAFFRQVLFFFLLPLVLAVILSGILLSYVVRLVAYYLVASVLIQSVVITLIVLSAIYISFFAVTWLGCKRMIRDGSKPDNNA